MWRPTCCSTWAHTPPRRLSSPALLFCRKTPTRLPWQGKNSAGGGRPSQLAVLEQLKVVLPVPFAAGSDLPAGDVPSAWNIT
jgi:hypothetical protein